MGDNKLLVGKQGDDSWTYPPEGYNNTVNTQEIPEESSRNTVQEASPGQKTIRQLGLHLSHFPVLSRFAYQDLHVQLYDLKDDPEERKDLSEDKKDVVSSMLYLLEDYLKNYVEADIPPEVPEGSPVHFNGTWSPGWCKTK